MGAVLLDSLVRLGARRTMSDADAERQSVLFQIEIYGKKVVDDARSRLGVIYELIRTGRFGKIDPRWVKGAEKGF